MKCTATILAMVCVCLLISAPTINAQVFSSALEPVIMNANFEDSLNRDSNRDAWRNKMLEADADSMIGDGSWVLQMSTTNYTPDAPADQGYSGKLPTGSSETSNRRWMYQAIEVEANKMYTISWYMKQDSGNTLNVEIYDGAFDEVSVIGDASRILQSGAYNDASGSNTGSFIQQEITFESGENTEVVLFISNDWENGSSSVNLDDFAIEETSIINSIEDEVTMTPAGFTLLQNYPNPFNPSTNIVYSLETTGNVSLTVYNMVGQQVATLVNAKQATGSYTVRFDAANLSSGVYLYKLDVDGQSQLKKMLLIK